MLTTSDHIPFRLLLHFHIMVHGVPVLQTVQQRGAAVIKARKLSSAMSAAKAICDHMRDIWSGTPEVNNMFNYTVDLTWERLLIAAIRLEVAVK